jgi:hypothetical protein
MLARLSLLYAIQLSQKIPSRETLRVIIATSFSLDLRHRHRERTPIHSRNWQMDDVWCFRLPICSARLTHHSSPKRYQDACNETRHRHGQRGAGNDYAHCS